jgi:tight adherence protein C
VVHVTAAAAWAVACGVMLGLGLWTLASLVPRFGRPRLIARVAPYVVDLSEEARAFVARRSVEPVPAFVALLGPTFGRLREALGRALGGSATLELRLRQAGGREGAQAFRSRQLLWSIGGAASGLLAALLVSQLRPLAPVATGAIALGAGIAGVLVQDRMLARAVKRRLGRITAELPTVLEFLTLSLSAGEGILDAIRRVSRAGHGEIAAEFAGVIAAVNAGSPLGAVLARLSADLRLPAFARVVDQVTGALDRGTPLAEVLRAQAQDARDDAKRDLLEVAGRKEVAMLVPLLIGLPYLYASSDLRENFRGRRRRTRCQTPGSRRSSRGPPARLGGRERLPRQRRVGHPIEGAARLRTDAARDTWRPHSGRRRLGH